MSISYVTFTNSSGGPATTLTVSPAAIGHLQLITVRINNNFGFSVTNLTGGGCPAWSPIQVISGGDTDRRVEIWAGTVATAGSSTLTITYSSGVTTQYSNINVVEFSSSYGTATQWTVDTSTTNDTTVDSTVINFPSLNAAGSGELYFGLCCGLDQPSPGSNAGYVWEYNGQDIFTYNTSVSGAGISPTASQSPTGVYTGVAALIIASSAVTEQDYALTGDSATTSLVLLGRSTSDIADTVDVSTRRVRLPTTASDISYLTDAATNIAVGNTAADVAHATDAVSRRVSLFRSTFDSNVFGDVAYGGVSGKAVDTLLTTDTAAGAIVNFYTASDFFYTVDNAGLSIYVPPPPPIWPTVIPGPSLHGLSADFVAAMGTDHQWILKVEVWNADVFLQDITSYVTAGSVSVDETAEIRRTCTLTVAGIPALIPQYLGDLLHPASCNELHISRGVVYADGTTEFAQLGVFRMTKPVITDDDVNPTITINGQDRASVVARMSWQAPYTIPAGNNIAAAIQQAMNSRLPFLQYNFQNITVSTQDEAGQTFGTPFTYNTLVLGADMVTGSGETSDPMEDLIIFAASAGCELFFDVYGVCTLRPIINPLTTDVIDLVHFVEGANCTMTTVTETLDESAACNGVIVYCNGTGAALPFVVSVWDTNPGSPTYYLGPWGQVPYIITTTVLPTATQSAAVARAAAQNYAYGQLQLILGAFDDVSLTAVPNPALREGDCVQVTRTRVRIDDPYVISTMTIPLDPLAEMDITFRPRVTNSVFAPY